MTYAISVFVCVITVPVCGGLVAPMLAGMTCTTVRDTRGIVSGTGSVDSLQRPPEHSGEVFVCVCAQNILFMLFNYCRKSNLIYLSGLPSGDHFSKCLLLNRHVYEHVS